MQIQIGVFLILSAPCFLTADEPSHTIRYVRPAGSNFQLETEITQTQDKDGKRIRSVTHRGQTRLSLESDFDSVGRLRNANVTLVSEDGRQTAEARTEGGVVTVKRSNGQIDVLDCPPRVIVTSAPDWTDTFMVMNRYDRTKGEEQQFDGLWIHPAREPRRLTFTVRHEGTDTVVLHGETQRLERFSVVLRNNSRYVAWRNARRQLVRLVADGRKQPAIILNGWEHATIVSPRCDG